MAIAKDDAASKDAAIFPPINPRLVPPIVIAENPSLSL